MSTSDPRASFVELSALLTGFGAATIAPAIDPVDLPSLYLATVEAHVGDALGTLLSTYDDLVTSATGKAGTPVKDMTAAQRQAIGTRLLGLDGHTQDPQVVGLSQAVMKLWYLGSWYQPFEYQPPGAKKPFTTDLIFGTVVSAEAYTAGLAWKAMQSHAMGHSTWTFGYWNADPPPLDAFTGNPTPSTS